MKKILLTSIAFIICFNIIDAQDAWTPAVTSGFDHSYNRAISSMLVFNGKIYAGAGNDSAYAYSSTTGNPGTWSKVFSDYGYSNIDAMATTAEGGGMIYLSEYTYQTPIQKVMKSTDGINWLPYFNSNNNRIKHIISFNGTGANDSIYLVVEAPYGDLILKSSYNSNDPDNLSGLWDTVLDFNKITSYEKINCISEYNNKLFFGTDKARLYSSADGNSWALNAAAGIGFGNVGNAGFTSIGSLGAYIYVGTKNYVDGPQIWRSNNEVVWDSVYQFPPALQSVTSINTIASNLWITTYHFGPQAERIYKTSDGTTYVPSNSNGFGSDNNGNFAKIVAFGNNIYSSTENFFPGLAPVIGLHTQDQGGQIWRLCNFAPVQVVVTPSTASYCGGLSSPPLFTATTGFTSYLWDDIAPSAINTQGFPTGGVHTVCAVDVNGCSSLDTVTVTLFPTPSSIVINPSPIAPAFSCKGSATSIATSSLSGLRTPLAKLSGIVNDSIKDYATLVDSISVSGVNDDGINNTLVSVTIDSLYHGDDGDLSIVLFAPNGSSMILSNYNGFLTQNFIGTVFSPTATNSVTSGAGPFTGSYAPFYPFSFLSGPTNGTWKIQIYDAQNTNQGVLKGWSLNFSEPDTNMTYSWSPTTALSSTSTPNTVSTALSTTQYSLTITNTGGCSATDTVTIIVPNVQVPATATVCYGSSYTITATGGTNFSWSPATSLSATTGATVTTNASADILYYVKDTTAGCTTIDSIYIVANPIMFATTGPDLTVCYADTANLSASASGGTPGYTYVWNYSTGTYPTQNVGVQGLTTGSATLTVTDAAGCTAANSMSILVTPSTDIYGHVNYFGGSLTTGTNTAVLYKFLPYFTQFDTAQTQLLNASGDYHFTAINHGDYLVKIFADTIVHPDLDPTYFGDVWLWDAADTLMHNCGSSDTANITMIHELGTGGGPGLLRGQTPTDPIPGVDVHLGKNPGGSAMITTTTDSTGHYYFNNVALNVGGQYYTVYVDIPGLGRDSSYSVILDAVNNQYMYLDYYVDSTTIYIVPNAGVGISNPSVAKENKFNVYPNPFKANTTVEYSIAADADVKLEVYNVLGDKINELTNGKQIIGDYKYNLSNLKAGVYFVALSVNNKTTTQRVIVIE
jgi:subtilisin-like proprotein convertase family protein